MFKWQDVQWYRFCLSIPFSIDYVGDMCTKRLSRLFHAHIAYEIPIAKITAEFSRISYCIAWFDTVEFIRLLCPNYNMYDDDVFADRFRYQLPMLEIRVWARLSRLLHAHIEYEIVFGKITARIWKILHWFAWFEKVEFNRLPSQNNKMYDDEVFADRFRCRLTMFEMCVYWLCYLDSFITILHMK